METIISKCLTLPAKKTKCETIVSKNEYSNTKTRDNVLYFDVQNCGKPKIWGFCGLAKYLNRESVLLTIITCVTVGLLVGTGLTNTRYSIFGLFMGLVAGLFSGFAIAITVGTFLPTKYVEAGTYELASIRSSDGTSGSFLAFGPDLYYTYFVDEGDGGLVAHKVNSTSGPTVRVHEVKGATTGHLKTWRLGLADPDGLAAQFGVYISANTTGERPVTAYDFYIPEGSLKRSYRLE